MVKLATFTANLRTSKVQRRTLNDRSYLVAPVVLINPGVLNGSQGPLLYPPDEVQANPGMWNNAPITLGHPANENGEPTSARDPDVLNRLGLGYLFNDRFAKGKRRALAWFDEEKTKRLDPNLYAKIQNGEEVEVSTGLFTQNEPKKGSHGGKAYEAIARNYGPDHLAVLTKTKGACSVGDGCGLNVTNQTSSPDSKGEIDMDRETMYLILNVKGDDLVDNGPDKGKKKYGDMTDEELTVMCRDRLKVKNEEHAKLLARNEAFDAHLAKTDCVFNEETGKVECKQAVENEDDDDHQNDQPLTEEEYLAAAPEGVRNAVNFARHVLQERTDNLVSAVIENAGNEFGEDDKAFLATLPEERLQKMAGKHAKQSDGPDILPEFAGMFVGNAKRPAWMTHNATEAEPLELPEE